MKLYHMIKNRQLQGYNSDNHAKVIYSILCFYLSLGDFLQQIISEKERIHDASSTYAYFIINCDTFRKFPMLSS